MKRKQPKQPWIWVMTASGEVWGVIFKKGAASTLVSRTKHVVTTDPATPIVKVCADLAEQSLKAADILSPAAMKDPKLAAFRFGLERGLRSQKTEARHQ